MYQPSNHGPKRGAGCGLMNLESAFAAKEFWAIIVTRIKIFKKARIFKLSKRRSNRFRLYSTRLEFESSWLSSRTCPKDRQLFVWLEWIEGFAGVNPLSSAWIIFERLVLFFGLKLMSLWMHQGEWLDLVQSLRSKLRQKNLFNFPGPGADKEEVI